MPRTQVITLKKVAKFSMISTLVLGIIIIISNLLNLIVILNLSVALYLLSSLLFAGSGFMLLLRRYQITSNHDLMARLIAVIGAIICCSIWFVFIYPIVWMLPKL